MQGSSSHGFQSSICFPTEYAHKPWELNDDEAEKHGFDLRRDYCEPLLDAGSQIAVKLWKAEGLIHRRMSPGDLTVDSKAGPDAAECLLAGPGEKLSYILHGHCERLAWHGSEAEASMH